MPTPARTGANRAGRRFGEKLERVKGIEPSYSAWKAAALPLSYTRGLAPAFAWQAKLRRGIRLFNKARAVTPKPWRRRMVGEVGLEPTKS